MQGRWWRGRLEVERQAGGEAARGVAAACTLVRCRALRVEHALGLKRARKEAAGWQGREEPSCVYCLLRYTRLPSKPPSLPRIILSFSPKLAS